MNTAPAPLLRFLRFAAIVAVVLGSTLRVDGQRPRAKLSSDLISFEARRTTARTRVIVRGSRMEIEALASRHGVGIARWLGDSAVLLANSAQISALAVERDAVLPKCPPGDDASGAIRHGGLDLAEKRLVVHSGREDRPGHGP